MGALLNENDHDYVWYWAFATDVVDHQYFSCLHVERQMRAAATGHAQTGKKIKKISAETPWPLRGGPPRGRPSGSRKRGPAGRPDERVRRQPHGGKAARPSARPPLFTPATSVTLLTRCHKGSRRQQSSPRTCSQGLRNTRQERFPSVTSLTRVDFVRLVTFHGE